MIVERIICIIMIILSLVVTIKPLKIMNTIRTIFGFNKLEPNDLKVFRYRIGGIVGCIVFSLFF